MTGVLTLLVAVLALFAVSLQPKPRRVPDLPAPSDDVLSLLGAGKRVRAIRAYRRQTGASLLEASRVITHHES